MMIVDQFNTTLSGGAAIAARRLHHALLETGNTSRFWYLAKKERAAGDDDTYIPARQILSGKQGRLLAGLRKQFHKLQLRRSLRGRPAGLEIFSSPRVFPSTSIDVATLGTDIIHLHWVAKLIDYSSFFASIPDHVPIVWTLHDMNPFTGGCHHADDCQQFKSVCQSCPQLAHPCPDDLSRQNFEIKQRAFSGKNIHIVTPSHWLEYQVRRSALLGSAQSIQTIRNGLDIDLFTSRSRTAARKRFGISENQFVIGCAAAQLTNDRKGFRELLQSLTLMRNRKQCVCLAMGDGTLPTHNNDVSLKSTGYLESTEEIVDFYSALDLFVITSKAENLPQTVVEAMACEVPTVGFSVGGIPEIVQHGRTGLLAPLGDCAALAHHIDSLVEWPEGRQQMGRQSNELAVNEFDQRQQTQKYLQLYQRALCAPKQQQSVA